MCEEDLECVRAWRNHPEVNRYMFQRAPVTAEAHAKWFANSQGLSSRHLLIYEMDGPAGFVQFNRIGEAGVAEWGFYLAPEVPRGSGYGLGVAALDHGFRALDFHKVFGQVLARNERSLQFHRRLGFVQEGVLREHHPQEGGYQDVHCFGLLRTEWSPSSGASISP